MLGPHFNPLKKDHGAPGDNKRHAGDLGNIIAGSDGVAEVSIKDLQIPLSGMHSILGRAVVVHADPDDLGMVLLLSVWFDWVCIRVNCSFLCCSRFRALIN
uniref:Superoxide dismutase copper/zinc binding domain-containing protein n=1 Tax=Salix viminalis TaxID=40686 RepID=A0A6N2KJC6_SALVM